MLQAVLSLFDGMSCGRIALERAGYEVIQYFASEIKPHAIRCTQSNYPNTIQIGDVTKVKAKLLCLSEVYSYICSYDSNLQSNISEWEVLYWLNKDFTLSTKIRTQKPNERQEVSEPSTVQRIKEVWFSNREMGSVRKFGDCTRSGRDGEENDNRTPRQLQCGKWWYDNDIYRRYKEENIRIPIRETQNGYSEKKNFRNIEETIFKGKESESCFGENEKSNVEERCSGKLLEREGEDKFSRKVKKEKRNGREKESDSIDEVIRELCRWDEVNGITKDYWNILRLHKEEQVTVVEYEGGFYIFKGKIDLCIGGSPCQSFSFAGKRKGMSTKCETEILTLEHYLELKNEGYEFEGQSYLFWEYMRLLNEVKPKYFLLENVIMGEKWEKVLSKAIGVNPIEINSALVSAQNRRRLYWTNIGMKPMGLFGDLASIIQQPKDKGILLKDILESEVDAKYYLSQQRIETMLKSERSVPYVDEETKKFNCLLAGYNKIPTDGQYVVHNTMPRSSTNGNGGTGHLSRTDGKTYCLDTGNTNAVEIQCVAMRGREAVLTPKRTEYGKAIRKDYEAGNIEIQRKNIQQLEPRTDGKTNTLTSVQKDNLVMQLNPSTESGGKQPYQQNIIYDTDGISPALMAQMSCGTHAIKHERKIRRLTPLECERLQTVKDGYTSVASDSQRYRMLGNGWTVSVISHIFSYLPKEYFEIKE